MQDSVVYFASPWFTPEQEEREERLKAKLRSLGFTVLSPKEEAICDAFSVKETRKEIFRSNITNILLSDILFAVTDGKDMGTIWEAGFACGLNEAWELINNAAKKIKIVYYCETLGGGKFNLMLAQSGDIIITNFEDLDRLPDLIKKGEQVDYDGLVE